MLQSCGNVRANGCVLMRGDKQKVGDPLKRLTLTLQKADFRILEVGAVEPPHADCRLFRALSGMESQCAIDGIWSCQRVCDAA